MNKYLGNPVAQAQHHSHHQQQQQLDGYEAEIVEDIPEQFDLARYKKSNNKSVGGPPPSSSSYTGYPRQPPPPPTSSLNNHSQQQQAYIYHQQQQQQPPYNNNNNSSYMHPIPVSGKPPPSSKGLDSTSTLGSTPLIAPHLPHQYYSQQQQQQQQQQYHYQQQQQQQQPSNQSSQSQQQVQFLPDYNQKIHQLVAYYPKNEHEMTPSQQQMTMNVQYLATGGVSQNGTLMKKKSSSVPRYLPPEMNAYLAESQTQEIIEEQQGPGGIGAGHKTLIRHQQQTMLGKIVESSTSGGRKKNSFEDDDESELGGMSGGISASSGYVKKEYYLKGGIGSETVEASMRIAAATSVAAATPIEIAQQQTGSSANTLPKSNLKGVMKKPGVTFDEKLEVYEVKNPHYGLEIKSEKREQKKKKKDKQKEDELTYKTKLDLRAKIQNQNMIHYYFYEKSLIYSCLSFYEENVYKQSVVKLQDKLRTSKPDEKFRDQLIQMIERDNSITVEIIRQVKKEYLAKLEPYLNQYQTTVDKLHTIPGMYQVMQTAANSVNFADIISYYVQRDSTESPSGIRKILGGHHDTRLDKHLNPVITVKTPLQRKADLWMPKNVIAAIDMHVRDTITYTSNIKSITDLIYKLNEICENDLHFIRALYKYVLITHLEHLRRNESGSILMRNYDLGIESTNTIFARLCSFAGIENHLVRGLWKTICQEPGEKVETKTIWNIVNLETGWRFVQPGFTPVKYYNRAELGYEESEFYFLSDLDMLFNEFLPTDKQCLFNDLLISNPKEYAKEFEKKPIVTPYFRVLQLNWESNYAATNIGKEAFKLAIKFPAEYADSIVFKYTLKPINPVSSSSSTRNQSLLNSENVTNYEFNAAFYVISELIYDDNAIHFKISALPEVGHYNFTVYATLIDSDGTTQNTLTGPSQQLAPTSTLMPLNQETKAVLSFRLQCSKLAHFEIPPNRATEINVFGTNLLMKRLGLTCCDFKQGVLGTDRDGKLNLVFEMTQPLDVEAYLYSTDPSISSKCLELCMLKRVVHNFLILIINPPHAGLYGLDLHAAPKGASNTILGSQLPPIGKFLIKAHHQIRSFYQFPRGDNRQWGPKQRFYDLGLHTVGNIDPYLVNEDGKQVEIEIAMLKSVTIWYKFDFDNNGNITALDNYCFMNYKNSNRKEKTVSFLLRFPWRGFYHLALMANDDLFPTKPDEIVYNYLIRVQDPAMDVEPFPHICNPILWKNCCLIAPKNYRLNSYDVHFSIIVPKTSQVQVSSGDRVLDKLEPREIENSWVGLVSINDHSKYIYIEAEFNNKFKKLIKFKGIGNFAKD